MPIGIPGGRQNEGATFVTEYSLARQIRKGFPPEELSATLFEGGAPYSFVGNVRVPSLLLVESGEWVARDAGTGKIRKATAADELAWPVFQGGSKRFDLGEGGLTVLQGDHEILTNMVDVGSWGRGFIRIQDALVIGILPEGHPFAGKTGLVNLADQAEGDYFVKAFVQEIWTDPETEQPNGWVRINTANANHPRTVEVGATTHAPTTED